MQRYENNKLTINVSANKSNYTQRNNEYIHRNSSGVIEVKASTMCNVTSIVMAAEYNGWNFPKGDFHQPEDNFAEFIMKSEEVAQYYKTTMPSMYADWKAGRGNYYTPNEVHAVLAYAFNQWVGCSKADTFKDNVTIDELIDHLLNDKALVISGRFCGLGHIVTLVGVEYDIFNVDSVRNVESALQFIKENKIRPTNWIIDDPYGDYHTNYNPSSKGNDIKIPHKDFIKMIKPENNEVVKWAHIISKGAATI